MVIPKKIIALLFVLIVFQAAVLEAHAMPALDSSFGSNGVARIGVPDGAEDAPSASALQRDGKLLVAGWSAGRQSHAFVLRLNANGSLDSTFGNGGVALFDLPEGYFWCTIGQIEQRPDGSIWIGARVNGGFMFTRLTPEGIVDPTFAANGFFLTADSSNSARFVRQANGGILIVSDATQDTQFALRLMRLTAAGERDLAFAPDGEKMLGNLPPDFVMAQGNAVAAEPDGGFTVMANAAIDGGTYMLVRVTNTGALNADFGADGMVSGYDLGNPFDWPVEMVRTADSRLLLLGTAKNTLRFGSSKIALWRVTSGGLTDLTFGATGRLDIWHGSAYSGTSQIAELANGGIAVIVERSYQEVILRRFDVGGIPDDAFGTGGYASITLADYHGGFSPVGIMPDDKGGLLIPGVASFKISCFVLRCSPTGMDVAVANLDGAGSLQPGYGRGDGFAIWNNPAYSNDTIHTILSGPSGKVVLAGGADEGANSDHIVARLTANGVPDTTFGVNGRVLPNQYSHFPGRVRAFEQENGAITVATGTATLPYGNVATVTTFRLDSAGALDAGFAPGFASPMEANTTVALRARPDGRLLYGTVIGRSTDGSMLTAVLEQHLPDDTLDTGFGTNGKVIFSISTSPWLYSRCSDIQVLADGSVVFAVLTSAYGLHVFKLDAQGAPVTSFGENGQFIYKGSVADGVSDAFTLLALADGSLLAAIPHSIYPTSAPWMPSASLLAVRVSMNGVLTGADQLWAENAYLSWALTALPDASVLVARTSSTTGLSALYRLYPDNSVDEAFGPGGAYPLQGMQSVSALATDAKGRILVAGQDSTSAIVARYQIDWPASGANVVEYYNTQLDHYFITADAGEAAAIDGGSAGPGWIRTGNEFKSDGDTAVCRFYGSQSPGPNSHFYTLAGAECDGLKQLQAITPNTEKRWNFESLNFISTSPIDAACPDGTIPVYRAYNNGYARGVDSNHRITRSTAAIQEVVSRGWSNEGVVMCAPGE